MALSTVTLFNLFKTAELVFLVQIELFGLAFLSQSSQLFCFQSRVFTQLIVVSVRNYETQLLLTFQEDALPRVRRLDWPQSGDRKYIVRHTLL